jgi:putative spermidine/putrescine transport system permease protein
MWTLLALPAIILVGVAFLYPLGVLIARSLTDPSPQTYVNFFTSSTMWRTLRNTVTLALTVTVTAGLIGFIYSYVMARASKRISQALFLLILLPVLMSWIVKIVGLTFLLQDAGLINTVLGWLGLGPLQLIRNTLGVTIGMTYMLLPYVVLPIYAVMRGIDDNLIDAARGLGASRTKAFWRVYFPLSAPGVVASGVLTFTMALGYFVVPQTMGNQRNPVLSGWIYSRFSALLQFGAGAAAAVSLIVMVLIVIAIATRFIPLNRLVRYDF